MSPYHFAFVELFLVEESRELGQTKLILRPPVVKKNYEIQNHVKLRIHFITQALRSRNVLARNWYFLKLQGSFGYKRKIVFSSKKKNETSPISIIH